MRRLISRLLNRHFNYRVKLTYRTRERYPVMDVIMTVQVRHPRYIGDFREIKKALAGELIKVIPKRQLCNGEIIVEPKAYLGWW